VNFDRISGRRTYNVFVIYLDPQPALGSDDYRRQARRIRASFPGNSFLTQRALNDLARRRDTETQVRDESGSSEHLRTGLEQQARRSTLQLDISAVVERGFSEHAASKLQPFGFTFSDRVALLSTAEKLGVSRFRANLILAMLENKAPARRKFDARKPGKPLASPVMLILAIEILVVCGIVWLLLP
jgi:hypothetical protein